MIMETILKTALVRVASDHGNFLLRNSLINPFPNPSTKEYMVERSSVIRKEFKVFSSLKNKKKNNVVPNDVQSNMVKYFRFMICFLDSKLVFIKGIKN
ncbi:hypothetical protein D9M72_649360 [compost metagenome]